MPDGTAPPPSMQATAVQATTVQLAPEQSAVLEAVAGEVPALLVTGRAGTGKSTLLAALVAGERRRTAVVAPTGVAALQVGGQTIHSLFKLPIGVIGPAPLHQDPPTIRLLRSIDVLVVDEVSMVSADLLDAMDRSLRQARGDERPFGGAQVVLFGDPWQLAPVPGGADEQAYYEARYRSMWFFDALVWERLPLEIVPLRVVHRQQEAEFRALLGAVRHGRVTAEQAARLNAVGARALPADPPLTLATRNDAVARINASALDALPGREATAVADIAGEFGRVLPADLELRLKEGARVMMLRNDADSRWVNGTVGRVARIRPGALTVEIDGTDHDVRPVTWERYAYSWSAAKNTLTREVVAEFTQLPVRLAWAVTIHKAQGTTVDAARIDLGPRAFSPGQTYVALSRLRTLDGLYLARPLQPRDVIVDPHVTRWMRRLQEQAA